MSRQILLHDPDMGAEELEAIHERIARLSGGGCEAFAFGPSFSPREGDTLYMMVKDKDFLKELPALMALPVTVVPLPWRGNPLQRSHFRLPDGVGETLQAVAEESVQKLESFLFCDETPVLGMLTLGRRKWRDPFLSPGRIRELLSTHLTPIRIETGGGREIKTACLAIEAAHEAYCQSEREPFFKEGDNLCQRACAIVYAPQSVVEILRLRRRMQKRGKGDSLPGGVGVLKSERLQISASGQSPLACYLNGRESSKEKVTLQTRSSKAVFAHFGPACSGGEIKESLRIQNLPTDADLVGFFAKRALPLVPIASEERFAELFTKLRESAAMPFSYLVLLLISVLMATTGLFQNSSPTIIGAMILAPLMAPIIAFAMGAVRFDETLMRKSVRTILLSILFALGASALLAWVLPFHHVTDQMAARTHPTLLDLAVALLSGVAAAYGYANSKVGESLAGVAIAVALVPPLCVSGIGLGWGDWNLFFNALLLFLANITGILFAAGVVFYLLGYASSRYVSAAFFVKLLMVGVIAAPLWLSTRTLVEEESIYTAMAGLKKIETPKGEVHLYLRSIVRKEGALYAVIYATAPFSLDADSKRRIAERIHAKTGEKVRLIFTFQELY